MRYLVLLRGVNVGGKSLIRMPELQAALSNAGFHDARTYIQSGNVLLTSPDKDSDHLAAVIEKLIREQFTLDVTVTILSRDTWHSIIKEAPEWWDKDTQWKHNLIVLIPPYDIETVIRAFGELKPDIERIEPGHGVIYQSLSVKLLGRVTSGKLSSSPSYRRMTIRNYNTASKLLQLLDEL
jgi:uncharacterized protein (DUF1697 family)